MEFSKIETNHLYRAVNWCALNDPIYIVSALPEIYLKHLFPKNVSILGSKIEYKYYEVTIKRNIFGIEKRKVFLD